MIQIPLRNRQGLVIDYALIDDEDAMQAAYRWARHGGGYAVRVKDDRTILLHREILGLQAGDPRQGDHKNRNRLDCRRENLRVATHAQNQQNIAARPGSTSQHRGVSWHGGKWRVRVGGHYLGRFASELEAAQVAARFRAEHMPFAVEDCV